MNRVVEKFDRLAELMEQALKAIDERKSVYEVQKILRAARLTAMRNALEEAPCYTRRGTDPCDDILLEEDPELKRQRIREAIRARLGSWPVPPS